MTRAIEDEVAWQPGLLPGFLELLFAVMKAMGHAAVATTMKYQHQDIDEIGTLPVSGCNRGHKMDTIGGKMAVRDRQVLEKMVSAEGIEPSTY